ncbi:MAG: GNAT family N-acetyltransferase, partial [Solirubrobacteraceae bacterium]
DTMIAIAPERLERGRLVYERIRPEHTTELEALLLDPRVYAMLHPRDKPPTASDVRAHVAAKHAHWERYGFGLWLMRDRTTGELAGRGGLQHTDALEGEPVEVAWAVMPARWGEGLATELAFTAVDVGFEALGLERLIAFTLPHNIASRRVMEKAGFTFEREIVHATLPHVLYSRDLGA